MSVRESDSGNGASVLVVEDDPGLSRLVVKLLEREGLAVNVVGSGQAAVDALSRQRPALLLLDYSLPDMQGDQLIETLAQQDRLLPFIVMTGHGNETLAVDMMKRGARDYLVKGGTLLELLTPVVKRVLGELETEQRLIQAEEAVQKSIELRAEILDALPAHVVILNRDGAILSTNAAWRRFALANNCSQDAFLIGGNYLEVCRDLYSSSTADSAAIVSGISDVLSGRHTVFALEYAGEGDQDQHWWRMIVAPLARAGQGGAVVMHVDVTDRKLAERALEASEMRFRSLADSSPIGIFLTDAEGGIRYANPQLQKMCAAPAEQMLGGGMMACVHEEDRERVLAQWTSQIPSGHEVTAEFRFQARGSVRWVHLKSAPLLGNDQKLLGHVGSVVDITEEKIATDELRASEERYRMLVEHAPDAIFVHYGDKIVFINDAGVRMLAATSRAQLIGRPVIDMVHPDSQDAVRERMRIILEQNRPVPVMEERIVRIDGTMLDVDVTATPCVHEGKPAVQVMMRDISARKRAEQALREHQSQLAHVMRLNTMGQMLSELAHEINQPLYAISNYSSACKQMLQSQGDNCPTDVLRWMQQISDQANRAGEILRRISRFVRKEPPEQTLEPLNSVVRNTVELVEIDARTNRGRIQLDLPDPSPKVRVDRIQIEQVLVNLLRNALEALEDSQTERVVTVTAKRQNTEVLVAVRDRGRGLSPSEQAKLFDAFFTTKPEGMGMGLPISRSIIEAHGGELWAVPNPDRGMTFYFTLPMVTQV